MAEVSHLDANELEYKPGRFVERREISDILEALSEIAGGDVDVRVIPIECESGTGKTWLLRHMAEIAVARDSDHPLGVGHLLETRKETSGIHSLYVNLEDWLDTSRDNPPASMSEAATKLLTGVIEQVQAWNGQGSLLRQAKSGTRDLSELGRVLETNVRQLAIGADSRQPLVVFLVDHVYESPWAFLKVLDGCFFGPLAAIPRVVLITAGRGRGFPWQSPDMWLLRRDPIRLGPLDLSQTRQLLVQMEASASKKAESVFNYSDGYPRRSYLIAKYGRAEGIAAEVAMLLSVVPADRRSQIQAYLEALCVVVAFDEDSIPRLLSTYRDHLEKRGKTMPLPENQAALVRHDLVEYGFAIWNDEYRGWVVDRVVQTAIMDNMFENRKAGLLVALEKCAYELNLERERNHPATAALWREAAENIRRGSLSSGWEIPRSVGRKYKEVRDAIDEIIGSTGSTVVYIHAPGGMGKTRLLKEIIRDWRGETLDGLPMSVVENPVDLYHTGTHTVNVLMDTIKEALDNQPDVRFDRYSEAKEKFEGASSATPLSSKRRELRTELRECFVESLNSRRGRLVLAFDTAERLDYAINQKVVEQLKIAAEEQYGTRTWLLESCFTGLKDAVILIAGRRNLPDLDRDLNRLPGVKYVRKDLSWSDTEDKVAKAEFVGEYFAEAADALHEKAREQTRLAVNAHRVRAWSEAWQEHAGALEQFSCLTSGNPILLALAIDYLVTTDEWTPSQIAELGEMDSQAFVSQLAQASIAPGRTASEAVRALAYLRKGASAELLLKVIEAQHQTDFNAQQAEDSLESLKRLTFVKTRQSDKRVFLHDTMYDLLEKAVLAEDTKKTMGEGDNSSVAEETHRTIHEHYRKLLKDDSEALVRHPGDASLMDRFHRDSVEDLYYELHEVLRVKKDPVRGFTTFRRRADAAVQKEDTGEGFLAELNTELREWQRDNEEQLSRVIVDADDAVRWVKWLIACDRWQRALEIAPKVRKYFIPKINSESERKCFEAELALRQAKAHTLLLDVDNAEKALRLARRHIARFPRDHSSRQASAEIWRQTSVEALFYNEYGYYCRTQGRDYPAIDAYRKAIPLWRALDDPVEQSNSLNNLAFAYSEIGHFGTASRQAKDALELRSGQASIPLQTLSLATLTQIAIREGLYLTAITHAEQALKLSEETKDERGRALALVALAEAQRRQATEGPWLRKEDSPDILLRSAIEHAKGALEIFITIEEHQRRVETLIQLGCAYRDLMNYLGNPRKSKGDTPEEEINAFYREALDDFGQAESLATQLGTYFLAIDASNRGAWQHYYRANHHRERKRVDEAKREREYALVKLDETDALLALHYPQYIRLGYQDGPRIRRHNLIVPIVAQIGKAEVLRGQMAFGQYLDERNAAQSTKARYALEQAIKHYARSLNCDGKIPAQFRDKRRAHDRIYDSLKSLNMREWKIVFHVLQTLPNDEIDAIPTNEIITFLRDNFGETQSAFSRFDSNEGAI
jgi:tetratricopeptide (TPR) repeat protein